MSRYPPLTIKQLKAIQEASKGNPDVRRLLWEIHRLHDVLFRLDIYLGAMRSDLSYVATNTYNNCMGLLDLEPSVRLRRLLDAKARRKDRGLLDHYKTNFPP